jgi:AcrR family transcriptional regulator
MSRPPAARAKVLSAAGRVLCHRAAAGFTLEAVAAEAGVSKGGLMYHFPTKEALLEALVSQAVLEVDEALAPAAASTVPGAFTRAYLDSTVPKGPTAQLDPVPVDGGSLTAALAAAVALDPRLLQPLRHAYDRWQDRLESDGIDPAAATAVRLAVDGWWLAMLLGLTPIEPDLRRRTRALLDHLAGPARAPGE